MVKGVATRVQQFERSLFYQIRDMVTKYKDAIYLSVGEPDFDTPKHIAEAGKQAIDQGFTHYSGDKGMADLRKVIAAKEKTEKGLDIDPENGVDITIGAGGANFGTIMALVNPGEEVIVPCPYYPSYNMVVQLASGIPKFMKLIEERDFMPNPEQVEGLITPRTKLMIINSPHNPTGCVFDKDCLESLADIAKRHDLYVLTDEAYDKLIYDEAKHYSIATFPGMFERTVITNSLSKTYAMTGWRVGYAVGPPKIIAEVTKAHYATNVSVPPFSQKAAIAALTGPQDCVEAMRQEYDRRRRVIVKGLNEIPGFTCRTPRGAFFAFPNIKRFGMPSLEFAKYLAQEARVATVPGSAHGPDGEGYLRISYAAKTESLQEAVARIKLAVEKIR